MTHTRSASGTQKTVLMALAEGWRLRLVDQRGWCLFQPNRSRPFATVRTRRVEGLTEAGWLTASRFIGLGTQEARVLTEVGHAYALDLLAREEVDNSDSRESLALEMLALNEDSDSLDLCDSCEQSDACNASLPFKPLNGPDTPPQSRRRVA